MALLIANLDRVIGDAAAWRAAFEELVPGQELRFWPDAGDPAEIEYLAFMRPDFDALPDLPNLKAMFTRSAGVEPFINHPRLPNAPLGKIEPSGGDPMMTEYVIMHVLRFHRDMPALYNAADVVVNPSLFEGMPNSVMEAMACARPVVAIRAGGTGALIRDGATSGSTQQQEGCSHYPRFSDT